MEESNTKRLACYAALKAGLSGNSYMEAFDRLFLALIEKKNYTTIDNKTLSEDFTKEYGFEMSYFPVAEIIGRLKTQKYIIKNNQNLVPNFKKINDMNIQLEINKNISQFDELIDDFKHYCLQKFNKEFDDAKLLLYINSFLGNQAKFFITFNKPIKHCESDDPDFFLLSYIKHIKETNLIYFEYFQSVVIGNVLANYITYDEVTKKETSFKKMRIFIDTGFAFRLLGIDELDRKEVYITIVNELMKLGAKVYMFNHSYLEMVNIIRSSGYWVGNSQYSYLKGSQTTYYFLSNNYSKEEINEYADTCKEKLQKIGVQISDYEYPDHKFIIEPYEEKILNEIKEEYKRKDGELNAHTETLEKDARSLFYLFQLRRNEVTTRFEDTKYIFVTTNHTLARISKKISDSYSSYKNTFPPCITDVFLGTIIWIRSPIKLIEYNSRLLIPQAYYAFQPSELLVRKMDAVLDELKSLHQIDAKLCYEMKTNSLIMDKIVEITQNDPNLFDEETPIQAIESMKLAIAEKTRNEVEIENHEQIIQIKHQYESDMIKQFDKRIGMIEQRIKEAKDTLYFDNNKLKEYNEALDKRKKIIDKVITMLVIGLILFYIFIMFLLWKDSQGTRNYFEYVTFLIPLILIIINHILKKKINVSIETFIHKFSEKKLNEKINKKRILIEKVEKEKEKMLTDQEEVKKEKVKYLENGLKVS